MIDWKIDWKREMLKADVAFHEIKLRRATALLEQNSGDPQAAYRQADQQGEKISDAQWAEAEARTRRRTTR